MRLAKSVWLAAPLLGLVPLNTGCGTLCGTLCWSTLDMLEDQKDEDDVFQDRKLNFRYRYPGNPYLDLTSSKRNPDATLQLLSFGPMVVFQIIAEEVEEPVDSKTLARISRENLKSAAPDAVSSVPIPWSNGEVEGLRFSSTGTIDGEPGRWEHFVFARNGFLYQLVALSEIEPKDVLEREADRLFQGFSLIDPARRSAKLVGEPFGVFKTASHPWQLELEGEPFETVSQKSSDIPAEVMGRSTKRQVYFALTPIKLEAPPPRRAALEALAMMPLGWQEAHSEAVPLAYSDDDGETRIRLGLTRLNEGREMRFVFGVVARNHDVALLSVWGEDEAAVREDGARLLERLRYRAGAPAWRFEELPEKLKSAHVEAHGLVGQAYLATSNVAEAIPWLRAASERDRDNFDRLAGLLRAYADQGQHKTALASFDKAPEKVRSGHVPQSWRAWLLLEAGARVEGRALFAKLFEEGYRNDDDFSYYAKAVEADEGVDAAAEAWAAYRAKESTEPLVLAHAELFARHERYTDAIDVLRKAQEGKALSPKIVYRLIDYELELGRGDEALSWVKKLEDNGFRSSDTQYFRGRALFAQGKLEEARAAFEEAKKLEPDSEAIESWRSHLGKLLGDGSKLGLVADITPVELPEAVRKKMAEAENRPAPTGHGASFRHVVRALRYEKGKPVTETWRWRIHVADDRGVSFFKTFRFSFDPMHDEVQVDRVVVLDESGKALAEADPRTFFVADEEAEDSIHTGEKVLHIPVPRLAPGTVVEIAISQRSLGTYDTPPYRAVRLAQGLPVGLSAFVALGDGIEPFVRAGTTRLPVDGGVALFVESPPVLRGEPWSPSVAAWVPMAFTGDKTADWNALSKDYLARIADKLAPNDGLQALAAEVFEGAKTREEKIDRAFAYAQSKLSYNAIEFGLKGIIPTPPLEAARRGYGDCKDHAALIHALLREAGISSHLVLVDTGAPLVRELPSLDQFNHMILYVPDEDGAKGAKGATRTKGANVAQGRFLDATDKHSSRAPRAPHYLAGQTALILDAQGGTLVTLTADAASLATTNVSREVRVHDDRSREVTERVRFGGAEASGVRRHLKNLSDEDRRGWARYVATRAHPRASLEAFEVQGLDDVQAPLDITLRYTLEPGTAEQGLVPASWERYFFEHPLVEERRSPFFVRDPMRFTSETRFSLPAAVVARAHKEPKRGERTVTGDCESRVELEAGERVHRFRCALEAGSFPREGYEPHRKAMLRVLEHVSGAVVLDGGRGGA